MSAEGARNGSIEASLERLERAVSTLEQRLRQRIAGARSDAAAQADQGRVQLVADLDAARARQRVLEDAAGRASEVLGTAIAELTAPLFAAEA